MEEWEGEVEGGGCWRLWCKVWGLGGKGLRVGDGCCERVGGRGGGG
jgi:hypothetical protein